jgi:uncharacterized protein involved in outer membrane biogenesis
MRRFLIVSLLVIVAAIAGVWWLLSDANRYKAQLVELVHARTGLAVTIDGDLSWRLWPPVQLVAHGVTADWTSDATTPLLTARTLRLDADLWPLLSATPKLVIEGVAVDGLHATLQQHGDRANWMPPGHTGPALPPVPIPPPAETPAPGTTPATAPWEVAEVSLSNAVIDYEVDGKATQISIDALQLKGIAPEQVFPLHAKLSVKRADREIPLTIAAQLRFDAAVAQWQVDAIDIGGAYGNPGPAFKLTGDARANTRDGTLDLANAGIEIGNVSARFDIAATDLLMSPQFSGHLDLPQQSLDSVTALLDTRVDVPIGVKAAFSANEQRIDLTDTELRYGSALVTGKLGTALGSKPNVSFDLVADRLMVPSKKTALASLGAGTFATLAFAAPSASIDPSLDEPLLPLDLIRSTDWNGKITIGQLVYEGAVFANAHIATSNDSAAVAAEVNLPEFFSGTATTQVKIDATTNTPVWTVAPRLNHVDSQALLKWLDAKYDWVAFFLAGSDLTLRGNSRAELTRSLTGHTSFDGGQGVINIVQIKNAALAVAKIAGGADKVNAWPDRLNYQRFTGNWDARGTLHVIDVALDNLTLKATGTLDTLADDMDLRATITVNDDPKYTRFKVGSSLMGIGLPIHCKGSVAAPKCGADEEGTRQLIADALSGKNPAAKEKLDKAIDEKVPEKYRDAARSLLEMLNKSSQQQKPTTP